MKKDIEQQAVEGVLIGIVPSSNDQGQRIWGVNIINTKNIPIENVIVNASGEGVGKAKGEKTAVARYFLNVVPAYSAQQFEILMQDTLHIQHKFWVSYYEDRTIFDKKFIVEPGMISEDELVMVPVIDFPGIVIE